MVMRWNGDEIWYFISLSTISSDICLTIYHLISLSVSQSTMSPINNPPPNITPSNKKMRWEMVNEMVDCETDYDMVDEMVSWDDQQ